MHEYQCKYCHEIYTGTVCPGCGAPVASATPVTGTYTVAQKIPKSYSAGKRGLKNSKELWIIGICLAAVLITFIICLIIFFKTVKTEKVDGTVASSAVEEVLSAPVFSHAEGKFEAPVSLQINNPNGRGTIYYTTNGQMPDAGAQIYTAPITLGYGTTTVMAIIVDSSNHQSERISAVYTIEKPDSNGQTTAQKPGYIAPTALPDSTSPEEVVQSVRQRYYAIQDKMNTLECRGESDGILRYYENGNLRKITIPLGVCCEKDFYYSREYYFDDNEMYFALLGDGTNERRFYFYNGQLVRMLCADGDILDNARNDYNFTRFERILLDEAMQYSSSSELLYRVYIGSFANQSNAENMVKDAEKNGLQAFVSPVQLNGLTMYRVQIGAYRERANAREQLNLAHRKGYSDAFMEEK